VPPTTGRLGGLNPVGSGVPSPWAQRMGWSCLSALGGGAACAAMREAVFDTRPAFGAGATLLNEPFSYPAGSLRGQGDWHPTDTVWGAGTLNVSASGTVNSPTDNVYGDAIGTATYRDADYILTWGTGTGFGRGSYLYVLGQDSSPATVVVGLGSEPGGTTARLFAYSGSVLLDISFPWAINSGDRVGIRVDGHRLLVYHQIGGAGAWLPRGTAGLPFTTSGGRVALETESDSQNLDDLLVTALFAAPGATATAGVLTFASVTHGTQEVSAATAGLLSLLAATAQTSESVPATAGQLTLGTGSHETSEASPATAGVLALASTSSATGSGTTATAGVLSLASTSHELAEASPATAGVLGLASVTHGAQETSTATAAPLTLASVTHSATVNATATPGVLALTTTTSEPREVATSTPGELALVGTTSTTTPPPGGGPAEEHDIMATFRRRRRT